MASKAVLGARCSVLGPAKAKTGCCPVEPSIESRAPSTALPSLSPSAQYRIAAGLSLRDVARRLHRAESTLLKWEAAGWPLWFAEQAARMYAERGVAVRLEGFLGGRPGRTRKSAKAVSSRVK